MGKIAALIISAALALLPAQLDKTPAATVITGVPAVITRQMPNGGLEAGAAVLAIEKVGDRWKVAPMSVAEPPVYLGEVDEQYLTFDKADIAALSNYGILKTETPVYDAQDATNIIGAYKGAVHISVREGDMMQIFRPGGADTYGVWIKASFVTFDWGN